MSSVATSEGSTRYATYHIGLFLDTFDASVGLISNGFYRYLNAVCQEKGDSLSECLKSGSHDYSR